jgi:hypothetical protein
MRILTVTPGHEETRADGPPDWLVADVHGGKCVLIIRDHPEDTLADMRTAARRLRKGRQTVAKKHQET